MSAKKTEFKICWVLCVYEVRARNIDWKQSNSFQQIESTNHFGIISWLLYLQLQQPLGVNT